MGTLFLTKKARIYKGANIASSVSGAEKTRQLYVKKRERDIIPYIKISSKGI